MAFFGITAAAVLIVLVVGVAAGLGAIIGGRMALTFEEHARRAIADLPDLANDPEAFEQRHSRVLGILWKSARNGQRGDAVASNGDPAVL